MARMVAQGHTVKPVSIAFYLHENRVPTIGIDWQDSAANCQSMAYYHKDQHQKDAVDNPL